MHIYMVQFDMCEYSNRTVPKYTLVSSKHLGVVVRKSVSANGEILIKEV